MNRDQRINEGLRLMLTAGAYVLMALACIVTSIIHASNESYGWAMIMWLIGAALLVLAQFTKRESLRTFPEPEADDD